jgi:very-short-patch-repair endonuclease
VYKQGVYKVGNVFIKNKTMALLEASKNKQFPIWDFNNYIFQSIDWSILLKESLQSLYVQRCKQLREKYDYLILNYSGGSDSWNILKTFSNNNIHLDEIFVYWPISATKGLYKPDIENKQPYNFLSEWDFHIKPDLEYIAKNYPKIKITINMISCKFSRNESYPEKYFTEVFLDKNINITKSYRIGLYELDFCILDKKIDIEVDGSQHYLDNKIIESDKRRNKYLEDLGWDIIRIKWSEYQLLNKQKIIK